MKSINSPDQYQEKKAVNEFSGFDLMSILPLITRRWYWFVITIFVALVIAYQYIGHTLPVYRTSATILVHDSEDRPVIDNSELLQGLGLPGGMKNMQNQITILGSRSLIENTLRDLSFEVEFYFKTVRNNLPIYPEMPLKINYEDGKALPTDTEFSLSFWSGDQFLIESKAINYQISRTAAFNEVIEFQGCKFSIECLDKEWLKVNQSKKLYFTIHSPTRLINSFTKRLEVDLLSREGSILRLSIEGTNKAKDADFLNQHLEKFQAISLERKNTEASRRINFIESQLVGISDSLSITENKLQQFRSSHKVMDLSAQGQSIIGQVTLLENEMARLNLEASYYDYLADYLNKDATGEIPLVPITMGINDPGLTRIVEELAELQRQLSTRGAGEMNPLQRNLEQRIRTTKSSLRETLNGLRRANTLARSEKQEQINKANAQASALPVTERQLLGIERKFRLNDDLYTFLLETRAEQEMQKASNRSDSEVVDRADARFSMPVSPNGQMIFIVAIFAGLALPLVIIYFTFLLDNKLKDDDLRKLTNIPIVGNIPHNEEKSNVIVFDSPTSSIAESFRLLRSRMQFLTKEAKSPIILITSTMPADGKTFTSMNLAAVYSMLGKKTILVAFDLRKPKIISDLGLNNDKGLSTWLIGEDQLDDIIQETSYDNLFAITAGPIPPNPSELIALEKTRDLMLLLKDKFNFIIIDSSPIGVVSDTYHLVPLADACLMVVRPGKTLKDLFENTLSDIRSNGNNRISLVINDIKSDSKHYGYGGKYGYTDSGDKTKKRRLRNKKSRKDR